MVKENITTIILLSFYIYIYIYARHYNFIQHLSDVDVSVPIKVWIKIITKYYKFIKHSSKKVRVSLPTNH
jgi:transcriptional regulator of met regulon